MDRPSEASGEHNCLIIIKISSKRMRITKINFNFAVSMTSHFINPVKTGQL